MKFQCLLVLFVQNVRAAPIKMYFVGWLMGNRKLKAKMGNKMNEGMIGPYREVVETILKTEYDTIFLIPPLLVMR